jgi:DNA-binding response OmpR family regulator
VEKAVTSILLVEDEKSLAAAIKSGLEGEGFAVDVAFDGPEGQWFAQERSYDVIVLDILLPEVSGHEICAGLRAAEDWTPVLMLTAKNAVQDELRSFETGADDYLTKPFAFVVLVARIRALLRRGNVVRPAILQVGNLSLDPGARRCRRGETEIELTGREFSVLEFLVRHEGDALSKSAILENVWDFAFDGDPNIVEVYMRRLRKKIDEPFGAHSIETVRGVGYRLSGGAPW